MFENSYICNAIIFHGNHKQQNFKINLQSGRNPHFMNVDYRNLPVRRLFLSKDKLATVCIYKITSPTGRIYIGQSNNYGRRISDYRKLRCLKQRRLYNSLKKHGFEKHTFEIIHLCKEDELNYWEDYYIKLFNTFNTRHGLNLKEGGGKGKVSDETKKRMKKSQRERFDFLSYEDCKKWIKENDLTKNIKTQDEWNEVSKILPDFIPKFVHGHYKRLGTWKGFGDFLGTGKIGNKDKKYYTYEQAKKWVQENELTKNIKSSTDWLKIKNKLPSFIPKAPFNFYKKQGTWNGFGDFFGTGRKKFGDFLSYEDAKIWLKENELTKNIKTQDEWVKITNKLPSFIPKAPEDVYKRNGVWKGLGDFLGTGNKLFGDFLSYNECKKWIKENELTKNIKTHKEWLKITSKLPSFIPKAPSEYYKKSSTWNGIGDFLGTGNKIGSNQYK